MATRPSRYVTRRTGSNNYYVRVAVPLHLQKAIGKREVWRSLGTSDLREAKVKAHAEIAAIQRGWHRASPTVAGQATKPEPTREELEAASRRYYLIQVDADLDERVHDPEMVRQFYKKKRYKEAEKELAGSFAVGDYSAIDVEYWADAFGFHFEAGSTLHREFAQLLMRAEIEATRRFADHDRGIAGSKPKDALFSGSNKVGVLADESVSEENTEEPNVGLSFSELYELHKLQLEQRLKSDTLEQRWKYIRRFAEYVGDRVPPEDVTKGMAREWRNALRNWPVKADQRKEFTGLEFSEVLSRNEKLGVPTISDRTRAKYLSEVSAFFTWLRREGYVEQNVFADLHEQLPRKAATNRTFTDHQLDALFSSPLFVGSRGEDSRNVCLPGLHRVRDWRFWLPILAAFSGARQGELAQLEVEDVGVEAGIHFLRITNQGEDPAKSLKNSYSRRRIPIHDQVVRLGFLAYVEGIKRVGFLQIFPELTRDKRGSFADVSKFYQKYFRQIGLNADEGRRIVFHSFRHRFTDELRRNFTEDQIKPLLGHSGRSTTGGYGEKEALSLMVRQRMIEAVSYDSVNWEMLLP